MTEFFMVVFYLLGGWMFILWTIDNPPRKRRYLCWSIPLWPLVASLLMNIFIKRVLKKLFHKEIPKRDDPPQTQPNSGEK